MSHTDTATHTPSIAFHHLPPKEGCRKPVLGVWQRQRPELPSVIFLNSLVCWFCTSCLGLFLFQSVTLHDKPNTVLKFDVTSRCSDSKLYANWFHTVMNPWPWCSTMINICQMSHRLWYDFRLCCPATSTLILHKCWCMNLTLRLYCYILLRILSVFWMENLLPIACTETLAHDYTSMLCYLTGRSSSNCLPFLEWSSLMSSKLWTVCLFVIVFWLGKRWWL